MKLIEAVITTANMDEVKSSLQKIGIERIMVRRIVNNGRERGWAVFHMGAEYMSGIMTKFKVEIVAADDMVGRVIETIADIAKKECHATCRIFIHTFVEASF
jgi:nitrogen regulatory protein PII